MMALKPVFAAFLVFNSLSAIVAGMTHKCQDKKNRLIFEGRCYWIIFGTVTTDEASQKCLFENAIPANIYSSTHFLEVLKYLYSMSTTEHFALGMRYDKTTGVVTNYDGSRAKFVKWSQDEPKPYRGVAVNLAHLDPYDLSNGMHTWNKEAGVLCETGDLSCPDLEFSQQNGKLECSTGNMYNSICTLSCDPGYSLFGSTNIICQGDLTWSGALPTCQPDCPKLDVTNPFQSIECTDIYKLGSTCTLTCGVGSSSGNEATLTCNNGGIWSSVQPVCKVDVVCQEIDFSGKSGTMLCTGGASIGSECSFSCNGNNIRKGPSKIICLPNGEWSNTPPVCKDVECRPIDFKDENGHMLCTDGFNYGSTCSFECDSELKLWGAKEVACLWNGKWTNDHPTCREFDPRCPAVTNGLSCTKECENNQDCNGKNKICCPSECGSVCTEVKKAKGLPLDFLKRLLLLSLLSGGNNRCPRCSVNACLVTKCPANLNAICRTSCNGCRAHFYDPTSQYREITNQCGCSRNYPAVSKCHPDQCNGERCGHQPYSKCRVSSCGQCHLRFYNHYGREVCRQAPQNTQKAGHKHGENHHHHIQY
ncbi:E-selectin-like isoform X1 [Styela clava]